MTSEQWSAVQIVAKSFGWDRMDRKSLGLMLWALFRYYAINNNGEKR